MHKSSPLLGGFGNSARSAGIVPEAWIVGAEAPVWNTSPCGTGCEDFRVNGDHDVGHHGARGMACDKHERGVGIISGDGV